MEDSLATEGSSYSSYTNNNSRLHNRNSSSNNNNNTDSRTNNLHSRRSFTDWQPPPHHSMLHSKTAPADPHRGSGLLQHPSNASPPDADVFMMPTAGFARKRPEADRSPPRRRPEPPASRVLSVGDMMNSGGGGRDMSTASASAKKNGLLVTSSTGAISSVPGRGGEAVASGKALGNAVHGNKGSGMVEFYTGGGGSRANAFEREAPAAPRQRGYNMRNFLLDGDAAGNDRMGAQTSEMRSGVQASRGFSAMPMAVMKVHAVTATAGKNGSSYGGGGDDGVYKASSSRFDSNAAAGGRRGIMTPSGEGAPHPPPPPPSNRGTVGDSFNGSSSSNGNGSSNNSNSNSNEGRGHLLDGHGYHRENAAAAAAAAGSLRPNSNAAAAPERFRRRHAGSPPSNPGHVAAPAAVTSVAIKRPATFASSSSFPPTVDSNARGASGVRGSSGMGAPGSGAFSSGYEHGYGVRGGGGGREGRGGGSPGSGTSFDASTDNDGVMVSNGSAAESVDTNGSVHSSVEVNGCTNDAMDVDEDDQSRGAIAGGVVRGGDVPVLDDDDDDRVIPDNSAGVIDEEVGSPYVAMPAHPRRKIETRVGSYGSGDGSDRRRNKNDRDFSMAWSRGANDRQEETEAAAVSSSSSSSSSSLDEFDLLYGPEYRPTPLEDPRLKEWAIVDEIGEGRDEDGVDISRAINEEIREAAACRSLRALHNEGRSIRAGTHPQVVGSLAIAEEEHRVRVHAIDLCYKRKREMVEALLAEEIKEAEARYNSALEQRRAELSKKLRKQLKYLENPGSAANAREDNQRMMTRHTRGSGNEPIEHVSLDKVPGLGRGGGHGKKGAVENKNPVGFQKLPQQDILADLFTLRGPTSTYTDRSSKRRRGEEPCADDAPRLPRRSGLRERKPSPVTTEDSGDTSDSNESNDGGKTIGGGPRSGRGNNKKSRSDGNDGGDDDDGDDDGEYIVKRPAVGGGAGVRATASGGPKNRPSSKHNNGSGGGGGGSGGDKSSGRSVSDSGEVNGMVGSGRTAAPAPAASGDKNRSSATSTSSSSTSISNAPTSTIPRKRSITSATGAAAAGGTTGSGGNHGGHGSKSGRAAGGGGSGGADDARRANASAVARSASGSNSSSISVPRKRAASAAEGSVRSLGGRGEGGRGGNGEGARGGGGGRGRGRGGAPTAAIGSASGAARLASAPGAVFGGGRGAGGGGAVTGRAGGTDDRGGSGVSRKRSVVEDDGVNGGGGGSGSGSGGGRSVSKGGVPRPLARAGKPRASAPDDVGADGDDEDSSSSGGVEGGVVGITGQRSVKRAKRAKTGP